MAAIQSSARGKRYDIVSDWQFRDLIFNGTCNGQQICLQIEALQLDYRISHFGKRCKPS